MNPILKKVFPYLPGVVLVLCMYGEIAYAGVLRKDPVNPRYVNDGTKTIYLTGSHTWNLVQKESGGDNSYQHMENYLDWVESFGHNFHRVWTNMSYLSYDPFPWARPGPGTASDGKPKFNMSQFDQSYFDTLRQRVLQITNRGMYVSVMLFGSGNGFRDSSWSNVAWNPNNNINSALAGAFSTTSGVTFYTTNSAALEIQRALVRKTIDTLNDIDNLMWEVINEGKLPEGQSWQYGMINYIKSYESGKPKQHLVGMTGGWDQSGSSLINSPADWISPDDNPGGNLQGGDASYTAKIIINDTDHLTGWGFPDPADAEDQRKWVWKTFARGHNPILMDDPDTYAHDFDGARAAMGHTLNYADKLDLANTTPQNSLSSTGYCLAKAGSAYIAYQPGTGSFTLNLSGVSGTYAVEWLNPRTGAVTAGSSVTGGASRTLTPPFSGDAVAYLKVSQTDTTVPGAPGTVRDGTSAAADSSFTYSTTQLSANWTEASDSESGISGYKYAIGSSPAGTNVAGWTTLGDVLTVTKTGLTLAVGATYYFSVKAVNGASLESSATNSNGQVVLAELQELVAHWKLDEASGSSAADSSGKGNTGALSGSPTWALYGGKIGGSLGFDGTDDYVNYGSNAILNFASGAGFTIAGWVKTTESYGPIIAQRSSTDDGAIIEIAVGYDGGVTDAGKLMALVRQDSGGSGYARITGGSVNNGSWHHFALKRNTSGSIELFLDGVSQGTNTGLQSAGAITTNLRALGSERGWVNDSYGTADQRYLNGMLDDVRVYNYALSAAEIQSLSNIVDTTPPSAPGTVRDGTGTTDINSTTSRTQLSANWTAAIDTQSGVSGYSYAIGTTAGGTNITNWVSLGNVLTVTKTGLTLTTGTTYYFSVKATNGAGLTGPSANSNGQVVLSTAVVDTTAPSSPGTVRDGPTAGTDAGFTYSTTTLSANWTASTDNESGITNYQFSIGTTPGATNITNWTAMGNVLAATKTGLNLTTGSTYYFSVKATNGAGLTGSATNSNGQYINALNTADTTAPSSIAQVRDGAETGVDADVTYLTDELSANWTDSADAESGISRYLYAIGTAAGATNITNGWKDNGELTEVTETGLTLAVGATYYFSVKAENGVGMQGAVTNSNGQLVLSQDSQGPVISNVSAQSITNAGGTIIWETDELATSRVEYGLTASYGSLTGEYIVMSTAHGVTLAGLQPATQYHYRVISRDYAGNESISVDYSFTTLSIQTEVTEVRVYPNPHSFAGGVPMKFKVSAAAGGEVRIYTIGGKLVRKMAGTGEVEWDGKNESGEKVARGIYIYRITQPDGQPITGKIAALK